MKAPIVALFASFINAYRPGFSSNDDEEDHHLEAPHAGELALLGVRATRGEQAGNSALWRLADGTGDGLLEQTLIGLHLPACLGGLVEAFARLGIDKIAAEAEAFEAIQHRIGLTMVDDNYLGQCGVAHSAQAEDGARLKRVVGVGDGDAAGQVLQPCVMDPLVRFIASLWLCPFCANVQRIG